MVSKSELEHWIDIGKKPQEIKWEEDERVKYGDTPLKSQPHFIHLKGQTATSESFRIALDFARTNVNTNNSQNQMVLFVLVAHNYSGLGYTGFRLNNELYTAHPGEKEVLFMEGTEVAVVGVDEVRFDEKAFTDPFMKFLNAKFLTIVYLFHNT